ncbi:scavenger receptor cysteine-rich type 1 protein M130-like [Pholidichthys leucotaenia]
MMRHKRNLQTRSRQEDVDQMKPGNNEACMQAQKDQVRQQQVEPEEFSTETLRLLKMQLSSSAAQLIVNSVRLLNGTSLCSGRLEVKSNQSWSSVCQADFDQQDAEVVCRELGCGPPSLLQGALYGDVEAPVGTKEFQCGGTESALLDCRSSGSARKSCSPGEAVGLTCSEPVRLVGGDSRCGGTVEVKHLGEWRPVRGVDWSLKTAAVVCEHLDCGSAVSVGERKESLERDVWEIYPRCVQSGSSLRDCVTSSRSSSLQTVSCSVCSSTPRHDPSHRRKAESGRPSQSYR